MPMRLREKNEGFFRKLLSPDLTCNCWGSLRSRRCRTGTDAPNVPSLPCWRFLTCELWGRAVKFRFCAGTGSQSVCPQTEATPDKNSEGGRREKDRGSVRTPAKLTRRHEARGVKGYADWGPV